MSFTIIIPSGGGGGGGADPRLPDPGAAGTIIRSDGSDFQNSFPAFGTEYVVGSGGPYTTIQAAITAAEAASGGVVYIRPGVYTEDITISSDTIDLIGASTSSVVIVGEASIDVSDAPGDAAEDHEINIKNLTFRAGAGDTTVLSITGNPQSVYLCDVLVDAGTATADGLSFNSAGSSLILERTQLRTPAGGSGLPLGVSAGSVEARDGCYFDFVDADQNAVTLTGGSLRSDHALKVRGRISNQSNGNGVYSIWLNFVDGETNNIPAFDAQSAGLFLVYRGNLRDSSGSSPDLGSGAGAFFWNPMGIHASGYANTAYPSANAGAGAISTNALGFANIRQVDSGGDDGDVLTADGAGGYGWESIPTPSADGVGYTPSNAAHWDPDPNLVSSALDDLGSRTSALESKALTEVVLTTVDTGAIDALSSATIDIALPSGITKCLVTRVVAERTGGTGTSCAIALFTKNDRSDDEIWAFGGPFQGYTVNPGPVEGPWIEISAGFFKFPLTYHNADASEFIRATVYNKDGGNSATYDITFHVVPME